MPRPMAENYAEIARIAFDLWQRLRLPPDNDGSLANAQRSLRGYVECVKAVSGEDFDLTKLT